MSEQKIITINATGADLPRSFRVVRERWERNPDGSMTRWLDEVTATDDGPCWHLVSEDA